MIAGRHLDSVILPEKTKTKLLADVDDFLSDETKEYERVRAKREQIRCPSPECESLLPNCLPH